VLGKECPEYGDVMLIWKAAGMVLPENWLEIESELLKETSRDLLRGDRRLFLFFDTCCLRERLNEHIMDFLVVNKRKANYLITTGVRHELNKAYNGNAFCDLADIDLKYKKSAVDIATPLSPSFANFLNQARLDARRRRIGIIEYKKLLREAYASEIESGYGDKYLIKKMESFSSEHNIDLLAFTQDGNFAEICRIRKIKAVQARQGKEAKHNLKWEDLRDLVFFSAIIFGFVSMGAYTFYGIWRGKLEQHWNNEEILVK